ncbi:hypothetical protein Cgig2_024056 [Carnegiea gigantea]|uniref:RNase H type-1 domain-containing protein n=1 Tax=Carnegiea gigantea TaxID=171969 RepID=A0A9Q1QJG2_9CARY|nr:hypothetical protein Cgig2_024056 [Carnegiea gigantea]
METILQQLGDFYSVLVDARGRAWGLAILWDERTERKMVPYSSHRIDSTVRSIWGSKNVILVGTHLLIGNGNSVDMWGSRWLPRPRTFAVITTHSDNPHVTKVSGLIDYDNALWREALIREVSSYVWNARNQFIFKTPDRNLGSLSKHVISFLRNYRESLEHELGCWGTGVGLGLCDLQLSGDVVLAGVQQGPGFIGPEVEEARACVYGLKNAITMGFTNLVIKGDCLPLIQKLRNKPVPNNRGNKVAHHLIPWQPFYLSSRIWEGNTPDSIKARASKDLYDYFNAHLI